MIIGKNFLWLHFPKCAGTETNRVLKKYFSSNPEIHFDKIDHANVIWHQNVEEREREIGLSIRNKTVICNFRRLPSWIISRIQFEKKRSGFTPTKDDYIRGEFYERKGSKNHADWYVKKYTSVRVNSWIRAEYITEDFKKAFSQFLDLSKIDLTTEFSKKSNANDYIKDMSHWFTQDDLNILYAHCPLWANLELSLYGELLEL